MKVGINEECFTRLFLADGFHISNELELFHEIKNYFIGITPQIVISRNGSRNTEAYRNILLIKTNRKLEVPHLVETLGYYLHFSEV
jgi:hypothetical protein